jgi:AAA+ lid domain
VNRLSNDGKQALAVTYRLSRAGQKAHITFILRLLLSCTLGPPLFRLSPLARVCLSSSHFSFVRFCLFACRMSLAPDVTLEEFIMSKDELSGADIKAICTEAGLLALRERRMKVTMDDFRKAKEKALYRKKVNTVEGMYL